MSDQNEQGAQGANEEQGAQGANDQPPADGKSINQLAKNLPWVQNALSAEAELSALKQQQADAEARAEREKAEAKQDYDAALKLEQDRVAELETRHKSELAKMRLETEFAKAGLADDRLVNLFIAEYDGETPAKEFVKSVKADERNAVYFQTQKQIAVPPQPPGGKPDDFDPERDLESWKKSEDPAKRESAFNYLRGQYAKQLGKIK
jgi:hypothetical protein